MRRSLGIVLTVVSAAVLATPAAAEFPLTPVFHGTLKLKVVATIPGVPKQKRKDKDTDTFLNLRGDLLTYALRPSGNEITGTMAPGSKEGRYDVVQPTGDAYATLLADTQSYFADTAEIDATITGVEVSGVHVMKKNGAKATSSVLILITGTATPLNLPFTATAKLKFKGKQAPS